MITATVIKGLKEIMSGISLDYFVLSETKLSKLDSSLPFTQFHINEYEVRVQKNGEKSRGGLSEFVRKGFIFKRLKKLEPKSSDHLQRIYNFKQKMDLPQCL